LTIFYLLSLAPYCSLAARRAFAAVTFN